jgi:hypothetical protein
MLPAAGRFQNLIFLADFTVLSNGPHVILQPVVNSASMTNEDGADESGDGDGGLDDVEWVDVDNIVAMIIHSRRTQEGGQ